LRRQHQKHEQHADRKYIEAGIAAGHLLIGQVGPFVEKSARSVCCASCFMMSIAVAELVPGVGVALEL